ncbi:MAG: hypothetical protein ACP5NE_02360 [Candidatus Micrarchaeia archaeon]
MSESRRADHERKISDSEFIDKVTKEAFERSIPYGVYKKIYKWLRK